MTIKSRSERMSCRLQYSLPPCVLHEDEHLLVVNKPAGWNTHAPGPYGGEGIYDWLRHREARWASLAILHRLDKETSGVMVFGKTSLANRSLTEQFGKRTVRKRYLLLTDRPVKRQEFTVVSSLVRAGEKYISRPPHKGGEVAETRFVAAVYDHRQTPESSAVIDHRYNVVEAEPLTGRTHQIRVHAAARGFPVLGDTLYGGTPFSRVCLHAAELAFHHPATDEAVSFCAAVDFAADTWTAFRDAFIDANDTNAYRIIHGAPDGWPGWYVDRLGDFLLSQSEAPLNASQREELGKLTKRFSSRGAYHKILTRHLRAATETSPQLVLGKATPERFTIRENGVRFELSFTEGYSIGLFLDQRNNRQRFLAGHVAAGFELPMGNRQWEILNAFAYTCGFSVCVALAGARTTSLDLSKKYLDWGRRNFALNGLDPAQHEFIYGDAFDWLRRLTKKNRAFDGVILDPPTFSQSKEGGVFRADEDYGRLVAAALPLIKTGGVVFASTNAAAWLPEEFLAGVRGPVRSAGRKILQEQYFPQPPDFPVSRAEPAYLKTVWMRIE